MRRLLPLMIVVGSLLTAGSALAEPGVAPGGVVASTEDVVAQEGEGSDAAVSEAADGAEEEDEGKLIPVDVGLSLGGSFGAATVLSNSEYTQSDYFSSDIGISLGYSPIEDINLSASIGYSKFLTDNGGLVYQREGRLSDTSLGVSWAGWKDEEYTGIRIGAGLNFSLPTSDFSQFERRYLGSGASLRLSRSFGGLGLSYSLGVRKNFHEYTSLVGQPSEIDVLSRGGGAEVLGADLVALDEGVLTEWGISNSFGMSFSFLELYSASLGLTYSDSWTYDNGTITQDDALASPYAVVGRGHSQAVTGSLSLSAQVTDWFGVGASVATSGTPLTPDNKSVRFPFWDFENGQAARTGVSFGAEFSY